MDVRWRAGSRFSKVPAQDAYAELEDIKRNEGGDLTPAAVVERAADEGNVLHDAFEWDNQLAAALHRVGTARNMIRSIQVVPADQPETQAVPIYHNVVTAGEDDKPRHVYQSLEEIMADPVTRGDLLRSAINEAYSFRKKYHLLSEMAKVHAAIDSTLERVEIEIN